MDREVSDISKLGVVLIAVAIIIGLAFMIFSVAKGTANDGTVKVQANLTQVGLSEFQDYDQKIITGTQVTSAYSNFEGKAYAVLISTQAIMDTDGNFTNAAGVDSDNPPESVETNREVVNSKGEDVGLYYANYNALLGPDGEATLTIKNGAYITDGSLVVDDGGVIQFNNNIGNLSKSGMGEYIPSGAKFQANLVKDASGSILGVAFMQLQN